MDPASLAFGLVAVFKDTYLTIKFIRNTIQSLKGYQGEQRQLLTHFDVQLCLLKNLSRLFRAANDNQVDFELLATVPDDYIRTVRDVLVELQQVLAEYAKLAASLDSDYQRFSPMSPRFKLESVKDSWEIDDAKALEDVGDTDHEDRVDAPDALVSSKSKRYSIFRGFGWASLKPSSESSKGAKKTFSLPSNVQWLFKKGELQKTLEKFREWNNDLKDMIGPLLDGFGFFRNIELQKRLRSDGNLNIFTGHIALNRLANDPSNKLEDAEISEDSFISLEEAKAKVDKPRVLAEFKQVAMPLKQGDADPVRSMRELYGPQLARLLQTASNHPDHSFRTLSFNSYAWDAENSQYIYLFDFPPDTSSRKPKSLSDLILLSDKEPRYKLELKQRFFVAQIMARAIGAFHSDGWLHKNIRAHAVKFFFLPDEHTCNFANPYLTDFEFSRPAAAVTRLVPQAVDLDHEVYRHPDRHGMPSTSFSKMHDIYSLGVVLLEIGLWQTARQIYDDVIKYDMGGVTPPGGLSPQKMKDVFLQEAKERLAHRMGSAYQEAAIACLDNDWDRFVESSELAREFQDKVGQKVDIRAFVG